MNPIKVLIIEDETIVSADLQWHLEESGFIVSGIARDYKEALKLLKNDPPDVALVDITLGESESEGIRIAKDLINPNWIPFIYLTAHSDNRMIEKGSATNPAAYLFKPFRPKELVVQVRLAYDNRQENGFGAIEPRGKSLYFPFKNSHERVQPEEILFLKAQGHCTDIYLTKNKKPQTVGTNIGTLEKYLTAPNFIRLSKSLLINLDQVVNIERTVMYMGQDKIKIEISEIVHKKLMSYLRVVRTKF